MYPDLGKDFFDFDQDFLSFFFRLPPFMMREAIERRDRIMSKLQDWSREMYRLSGEW
jgi:hypothetical protein